MRMWDERHCDWELGILAWSRRGTLVRSEGMISKKQVCWWDWGSERSGMGFYDTKGILATISMVWRINISGVLDYLGSSEIGVIFGQQNYIHSVTAQAISTMGDKLAASYLAFDLTIGINFGGLIFSALV